MLVRPFLALLVTLLPPGHGLGDMASGPGATRSARCSTTTSRDALDLSDEPGAVVENFSPRVPRLSLPTTRDGVPASSGYSGDLIPHPYDTFSTRRDRLLGPERSILGQIGHFQGTFPVDLENKSACFKCPTWSLVPGERVQELGPAPPAVLGTDGAPKVAQIAIWGVQAHALAFGARDLGDAEVLTNGWLHLINARLRGLFSPIADCDADESDSRRRRRADARASTDRARAWAWLASVAKIPGYRLAGTNRPRRMATIADRLARRTQNLLRALRRAVQGVLLAPWSTLT